MEDWAWIFPSYGENWIGPPAQGERVPIAFPIQGIEIMVLSKPVVKYLRKHENELVRAAPARMVAIW